MQKYCLFSTSQKIYGEYRNREVLIGKLMVKVFTKKYILSAKSGVLPISWSIFASKNAFFCRWRRVCVLCFFKPRVSFF